MPTCPECSVVFRRSEHLTRHRLSVHCGASGFKCSICSRTFNRSDSLRRHCNTHAAEAHEEGSSRVAWKWRRSKRACLACANAREKCSGQRPCNRCHRRGLSCRFHGDCDSSDENPGTVTPSEETCPVLEDADNTLVDNRNESFTIPTVASATVLGSIAPPDDLIIQNSVHQWPTNQVNWLPVLDHASLLFPHISATASLPTTSQAVSPSAQHSVTESSPLSGAVVQGDLGGQSTRCSTKGLYIHGKGSREARVPPVRPFPPARLDDVLISNLHPEDEANAPSPQPEEIPPHELQTHQHDRVLTLRYPELLGAFDVLCTQTSPFFTHQPFTVLPTTQYMSDCLAHFRSSIAHEVPLVPPFSWKTPDLSWLTLLAAITAGSTAIHPGYGGASAACLKVFLDRAIRHALSIPGIIDPIAICQACLLNTIAESQSEQSSWSRLQLAYRDLSVAINGLETGAQDLSRLPAQGHSAWSTWVAEETRRRLRYFAWHFVCSSSLTWRHVTLENIRQLYIPCPQALWDAQDEDEWSKLQQVNLQAHSMDEALQRLYLRSDIAADLDSYGMTSLVHVVINRTFEVAEHLRNPLNRWTPTPESNQESTDRALAEQVEWLPANSVYAAWRNSACDCLDLIHWRLHQDITAMAGFEPVPVLHLHLARLLLLTPFNDFIDFANQKPDSSSMLPQPAPSTAEGHRGESNTRTAVMRWLTLDDNKGRLAVIHAGAAFWHLARFSQNSIYAPITVLLASLVLWIYGVYQPAVLPTILTNRIMLSRLYQPRGQISSPSADVGGIGDRGSSNTSTAYILIDRPCDDEIIQTFVSEGHTMQPIMFGGTRLCSAKGCDEVLRYGVQLLFLCRRSGRQRASEYQQILVNLMAIPRAPTPEAL